MKAALKSSTMPTTATTQDFTDSIFNTDVKLMMPFFSRAITNNTIAEEGMLSIGAYDGTTQFAVSTHFRDNKTLTTGNYGRALAAFVTQTADSATSSSIAEGTGSFLNDGTPDGGRITWSDINLEEIINCLVLGGSDVAANVQAANLNGTTNVTITHGLGATPDAIIMMGICVATTINGGGRATTGWYDVANNSYVCLLRNHTNNVGTTIVDEGLLTDCAAAQYTSGGTPDYKVTVNTAGSTTYNIVASAATTDEVFLISLKINGGSFKAGTFLTRTSTGTQADITGMGAKPKLVFYLPTLLTSLDTVVTSGNTNESVGFGIAVDNEGVTEQGCIAKWFDDGVGPLGDPSPVTDAKSYTSNTKAGMAFSGTGTKAVEWSVSSWDSGGVTNNYSTSDSTGRYVGYLAIAPASTMDPIRLVWRK